MPRTHMRRALAALFASLAIAATAIPPIGGIVAAAPGASCPDGDGIVCELVISAPQSVLTGVPFTVQVLVTTDGTTLAKGDPCASSVVVSLDLSEDNGEGFDFVQTYTATAANAVATFSVTASPDNIYELYAYVQSGESESLVSQSESCAGYDFFTDTTQFTAVTVPATQPIAPCPDNVSCKQVVSNSGSAATLIAEQGSFTASFGALVVADGCGDGGPADSNGVLTFDYTPGVDGSFPKTIILALSRERVTKGIGQFKICWHSDTAFTPLGGGPQVFTGYLAACKKKDLGPCVLFQKSNQHNTAFFGILAPEIDPKAYPK